MFTEHKDSSCFRKGFVEYVMAEVYFWKINTIVMRREGVNRYPVKRDQYEQSMEVKFGGCDFGTVIPPC